MNDELKRIIEQSKFEIQEGTYIYTKVSAVPNLKNHFLVSKDKDEITVVTRDEYLGELNIIERNKENYKLIALNVSVPFYAVGFLATVTYAIAEADMNVLVISTYSKDYILVKQEKLEEAVSVLLGIGFSQK